MEVGAIQVPVNPASTPAESTAFVPQVQPRLVVDDGNVAALFDRAGRRAGTGRNRRIRRRGDDPDIGHDRSLQARDADAPRVRDGGRGVPVLDAAHRRRPADDVAAAVPHQRARVLDARLARCPRASLVLLPGFSASTFIDSARTFRRDRVQRDRRDARDPHAPTGARRRRRQPDPPLLHGPVARTRAPARRSKRASASRSCAATRCRSRRTARSGAHGTRPYGTLGSARQHPTLGHVNDARVRRRWRGRPGEIGELELRNPAIMRGYYEMPDGDRGGARRRLAADRRPRRRQRRRHVHVRRPQEGSDPPAR